VIWRGCGGCERQETIKYASNNAARRNYLAFCFRTSEVTPLALLEIRTGRMKESQHPPESSEAL